MTRSHPSDDVRGDDARGDPDSLISGSGPAGDGVPVGDGADARSGRLPADGHPTPPEPDASTFLIGPEAVRAFVEREWKRKLDYRLKKEVWTYSGDQVSILFEYEWHDAEADQWISTYGEEHWEIGPDGLLRRLDASGRDIVITNVAP